jgi:hypothetical protein
MVTIPAGTSIEVALQTPLSTETSRAGEPVVAKTLAPIRVGEKLAIPAGATMNGRIQSVQASGRVKGRAQMAIAFDEVVSADGDAKPIRTQAITMRAKSETGDDIERMAAGTIAGAIIGGIAGGGDGAAKGGAIGAGAGTVWVLATKGDEIELPPGRKLTVEMLDPVEVVVASESTKKGGA